MLLFFKLLWRSVAESDGFERSVWISTPRVTIRSEALPGGAGVARASFPD